MMKSLALVADSPTPLFSPISFVFGIWKLCYYMYNHVPVYE